MEQKKLRRVKVPNTIKRQLASFYEGAVDARLKCVVTQEDINVEIHHLDEDRSNSRCEYNLVPLSSGFNTNIDRRDHQEFDPRLTTTGLSTRSGYYYSRGEYAYGYGCSILGASIRFFAPWNTPKSDNYHINADDVSFFCSNALVNLRPLNRVDYASHVLKTIVVPLIRTAGNTIKRPTLARLAMEIGSYFRDVGKYARARNLTELARFTLRNEVKSMRIRTLYARLWQHEGIAAICEGNLELADKYFHKADAEITSDYSIGHANESLYEAHMLLRLKTPPFDQILHVLKRYPSNSDRRFLTKWTDIELRIAEAQAEYQKRSQGSKERAFARLRNVLERIGKEMVVPTRAIFSSYLFAFADEYPSHRPEIQELVRTLPLSFQHVARTVEYLHKKLSHEKYAS